jgi:glutamyl-tRNA reductase
MIGMSWRNGGAEALARFTVPASNRPQWLKSFAQQVGVEELVYLATCNRVEIAFVTDGPHCISKYKEPFLKALTGCNPEPDEADSTFQVWCGEDAAKHLFLIASGLDSARIGECEISGQVRDAYETSRDLGLTGPRLDLIFEEAFKVGRRVRSQSSVGEGRQSLAEIALDYLRERLKRSPGPVAFVGVSPMTERCARAIAGNHIPIFVINRTLGPAETLAKEISGEARTLEEFRDNPVPVEAVMLATGSPDSVLKHQHLERLAARSPSGEPPLIIDLAIPPDVNRDDARKAGVTRYGMEDVLLEAEKNRERRLLEAEDARLIVDEAMKGLRRRLLERILSPLFATLQRRYRKTALEGCERLFRKELSGLGEYEKEAVKHWAETLARRFAHLPTAGLRGVAFEFGPGAVEAALAQADDSMIKILREASDQVDVSPPTKKEDAA